MKSKRLYVDPAPGNPWGASAEEYVRLSEEIAFYPAIARRLVALTPPSARVVLDFGCGNGRYTRLLLEDSAAGARPRAERVYLVDSAAEMLRLTADLDAGGVPMVRVVDDEALENVPGEARGSVDVIACSSSFHLCRDMDLFLERCGELLRPGGRVVANIPDQDFAFPDGRPSAFLQMADQVFGGYAGPRYAHLDDQVLQSLAGRNGYRCDTVAESFEVSWDDFIRFFTIPFIGIRRMPGLRTQEERVAHLAALRPRFDTLEYRWVFVTFTRDA